MGAKLGRRLKQEEAKIKEEEAGLARPQPALHLAPPAPAQPEPAPEPGRSVEDLAEAEHAAEVCVGQG